MGGGTKRKVSLRKTRKGDKEQTWASSGNASERDPVWNDALVSCKVTAVDANLALLVPCCPFSLEPWKTVPPHPKGNL